MTSRLPRTIAAELGKLAGLPAAVAAVAGTIAVTVVLVAALAASAPSGSDAGRVVTAAMPFLRVGPILLGVVAAGSEYAGRQVFTSLAVTPARPLFLAGKTLAFLITTAVLSVLTVGAGTVTAFVALAVRGDHAPVDGRPLAGAAAYLVLIGLLALALAVLLRSQLPPLVTMLGLVLVLSPLLSGLTEHARWLPDRAGSLLYQPGADTVLTPAAGALVLLCWTAATGAAAAAAFLARDA